jgi:valyl-tRNA synthetase
VLVRLLHPLVPFITEEVWQLLGQAAPARGLRPQPAAESVMIATWPEADVSRQDPQIEQRFAVFQQVLSGLREIRSRQNIPPKTPIRFVGRCDDATAGLLAPMNPYFAAMANAQSGGWGSDAAAPATGTRFSIDGGEILIDMSGHIDVQAEITRKQKELSGIAAAIQGKRRQLDNRNFVERAPADVVEKERSALSALEDQERQLHSELMALKQQA